MINTSNLSAEPDQAHSSTLFIQTFQAHTDGEGSGRISEGGAYGK
jgi:hypothetical protein